MAISFAGSLETELLPLQKKKFKTEMEKVLVQIEVKWRSQNSMKVERVTGCGVMVSSAGLILTSKRLLITKPKNIKDPSPTLSANDVLVIYRRKKYEVSKIVFDRSADSLMNLALLKVVPRKSNKKFDYVNFAQHQIVTGQDVHVFTFELGVSATYYSASVAKSSRMMKDLKLPEYLAKTYPKGMELVQVAGSQLYTHSDCEMIAYGRLAHGMLGAPYFNSNGELVGIFSFRLQRYDFFNPIYCMSEEMKDLLMEEGNLSCVRLPKDEDDHMVAQESNELGACSDECGYSYLETGEESAGGDELDHLVAYDDESDD